MFRTAWLLPVTFVAGCASIQDTFCNLVESDSYVLVSVARCQTMQVSFDYDAGTDFSVLETYDWMPAQDAGSGEPGIQDDSQLQELVTDAVDAKLAEQGFRLNREAPDFLVNYDLPVERQGTLTLTFVHPGSRQFFWRGMSTDEAYTARNQDVWARRIHTALDKLLGEFPPRDPHLPYGEDEGKAGEAGD